MNQGNYQPVAPQTDPGKGMSIAAMILGIVAIAIAWWGIVVGIISIACAVTGLILAIVGRKKSAAVGVKSGIGTAALVLTIIGLVLSAIGLIACSVCAACTGVVVSAVEDSTGKSIYNITTSDVQDIVNNIFN